MSLIATSQKELANTIGVGERTIASWLKEGCPGKAKKYVIREVIEWARENKWSNDDPDGYLLDSIPDDDLKATLVKERIEKLKRENRLADFQIDKMSASLVDVSIVEAFLLRVSDQVKSAIEVIEKKHGNNSCAPIRAAFERIEKEVEEVGL